MTSFKKLQLRQAEMKARLVELSELDPDIVENIMQYGKHLVHPGTNDISDNVFMAQMMNRFHITNQIMVNQMFEVLQRRRRNAQGKDTVAKCRFIPLEDYCWCICMFLTDNVNMKIDWVFSVYDANDDGVLTKMELYLLLKPCILHSDEMETEEATKDLIDIVMSVVDMNRNGSIDLEEFRCLVKRNILYIDLLGQCLPHEKVVKAFLKKIQNKSPMEVSRMFEEEREKGIMLPLLSSDHSLYPIHLDLP